MVSIRELRSRIKGVESTGKVTKSMKMVSASKLRRTQSVLTSFNRYYTEFHSVLQTFLSCNPSFQNRFFSTESGKKPLYILFSGNRGLCGTYNTDLLRYYGKLVQEEKREYKTILCGKWMCEAFPDKAAHVIDRICSIPDVPDYSSAVALADRMKDLFLSGECDEVILVYQKYKSALKQLPSTRKLLPLSIEVERTSEESFIFEPDKESIMDALINAYISAMVYSLMLESKSGEHISRMTAMGSASDNTDELLAELNLELNNARQSVITTEITEIVGGARSLNIPD